MASIQGKAHISIDGYLFMLARMPRTGRHIYGREEAPHFVSRTAAGDPNYRDSTFFPHWVQNNWQNGFDQEKFNDGAKFYRSSKVDPTDQEKLTLQKAIESAGAVSGVTRCFGQRSSSAQGWWNTSYQYRQQITITAQAGQAIPVGVPIKITVDTASLVSQSKLRSDRKDWRIVYANGTSFTDLTRDYITTTSTIFAVQSAITAGQSDSNYFIYYGYSSESTDKQPTTKADWNAVYGMYGTTPDASSVGIWHFREGSGATVADESSNSNPMTIFNTPVWETDGALGRKLSVTDAGNQYWEMPSSPAFDLGSFTLELYASVGVFGIQSSFIARRGTVSSNAYMLALFEGKLRVAVASSGGSPDQVILDYSASGLNVDQEYHFAATYDGSSQVRLFVDGVQVASTTFSAGTEASTGAVYGSRDTIDTNGRMTAKISHMRISNIARTSFPYVFTPANKPTTLIGEELGQASTSSTGTFEVYRGADNGDVQLWDGVATWTTVFNVRRLVWFDTITSKDSDKVVGDVAGVETAQAQSFTLATAGKIKGVNLYMKIAAGTPTDITVRLETNNSGVPSGTLVDSSLTVTIPSTALTSTYGFIPIEFPSSFALTASTTYWIVVKAAAASNDNNYTVGADASSPAYANGTAAHSTDGGTTWSADSGVDLFFRIIGEGSTINQITQATFSSNTKLWIATGDPTNTTSGNARLYTYDGTSWVLAKTFTGTGSAAALSLQVFNSKLYVGLAPTAAIYVTADGSTFTLSKDIDDPGNPGYVWDMEVYNGKLYACGGHPEYVLNSNSQGFLWAFDEFQWQFIYDFSFTVIKSLGVFDNLLFLGTTHKKLYVYNTASMDKLEDFPWDVSITSMTVYDDQLAIGLTGTNSLTGQEAVYLFDRNGFHNAYVPGNVGITALYVARNQLLIGHTGTIVSKINPLVYVTTGYIQTSYFEASLPSIDKLWRSIILQYEALPQGCSLQIEYKTDESDLTWTNVGTVNASGTTLTEFTFANAFYSKKISLKITLVTTDTSVAPVLKIQDVRYLVFPDFKYLWKISLVCPDKIVWLDGTEPIAKTSSTNISDAAILDITDTGGFPIKGRAVVVDDNGIQNEFTFTGKNTTSLTGCVGLVDHLTSGLVVKITGATMHKQILTLKRAKQFYSLVDIDGLSYTTVFNQFRADNFVVNQELGLENNVPISLLEV